MSSPQRSAFSGATILAGALEVSRLPAARFRRALEDELWEPVQVNVFYSPPATSGVVLHLAI
jgi:hypothetical protein